MNILKKNSLQKRCLTGFLLGLSVLLFPAFSQHRLKISLHDGSTHSYETEKVERLDFMEDNYMELVLKENNQIVPYKGNIDQIDFEKQSDSTSVHITASQAWFESAYICWDTLTGADSYHVYYKLSIDSVYQALDAELIRNYGHYGRADALGLVQGDYVFKVIPVDHEGEEMTDWAAESDTLSVFPHDRSGYAHFNNANGVGAYKGDGSLKDNAVVFYITKDNCNTITHEVIVDKKGKKELCTGIGLILSKKQKGYDQTPWAIRFIGTITNSDFDEAQLLGEKNSLQVKANDTESAMNVTLEGVGNDATAYGWGITLYRGCGVEVRNLGLMLFQDDGIQVKSTKQAWIHHCDFFYGKVGSDADQVKGDGSMDVKSDCTYSTFSYNHFWDSGKASLCGLGESGENWLTYHHNWFDHSDSRHPRVRTMTVHVYNNYYDGVSVYGVGACKASNLFVEANYFRGTKRPMMISMQGTDIKGGKGTFSSEDGGMIKSFNNVFAEKPANFSYITHLVSATGFDAYHATDRNEIVPSTYVTLKGATSYSNFDTDSTRIYSYTPDDPQKIPNKVTSYAGRTGGSDFQWDFVNSTDDVDESLNGELKAALQAYKSKLQGLF